MPATEQTPEIIPGKKYRFEVKSAEEAVRRIRDQMGTRAKVISVNQIEGKGIRRLVESPRLEVIAMIPVDAVAAEGDGQGRERTAPPQTGLGDAPPKRQATPSQHEAGPSQRRFEDGAAAMPGDVSPAQSGRPRNTASAWAYREPEETPEQRRALSLCKLLERSGFCKTVIHKLESSKQWPELLKRSTAQQLVDVGYWLKSEYYQIPRADTGSRLAFIGLPGAGKSTALCKQLSVDVFARNRRPTVLKLDGSQPTPGDFMAVYCDILGCDYAPCFNDDTERFCETGLLYVDTPGIGAANPNECKVVTDALDALGVTTRVLVINAAYDSELIKQQVEHGHSCEATHLVLTHLDEVRNCARLWPIVLYSGLTPLFVSTGQDLAGDRCESFFEYLIQATMPEQLM